MFLKVHFKVFPAHQILLESTNNFDTNFNFMFRSFATFWKDGGSLRNQYVITFQSNICHPSRNHSLSFFNPLILTKLFGPISIGRQDPRFRDLRCINLRGRKARDVRMSNGAAFLFTSVRLLKPSLVEAKCQTWRRRTQFRGNVPTSKTCHPRAAMPLSSTSGFPSGGT